MSWKKWLVVIGLMGACSAGAGIRILLNAGGFAEMQALSALSQLKMFTFLCLTRPGLCQLNEEETKLIGLLDRSGLLETKQAELEFFPAVPGDPVIVRTDPARPQFFALASDALYSSRELPLTYGELTELVFWGWLHRRDAQELLARHHFSFQTVTSLAGKVFRGLTIQTRSLRVDQRSEIIHQVQIFAAGVGSVGSLLALESEKETMEFTPLLVAALPCPAEGPIALEGVRYETPHLLGQLTWQCKGQLLRGQFSMELIGQEELQMGRPSIFAIQPIGCGQILEGSRP